jgi:dipeptide/tripeptide permease
MPEAADTRSVPRLPPLPVVIAGLLVVTGILLSLFVSMAFLILVGLGAFGPGLLRELGWLRDEDEFQRQAAYRAGYVAYLVGGFTAVVVISVLKWREANLDGPVAWVALVLIVLWGSWLFASRLRYWGARKMTSRLLVIFGLFWAAFVVGGHWTDPAALLMGSLVVMPFFLLAWSARRFPRATGIILLVLAAVGFWSFFDVGRAFGTRPTQLLTFALLLAPLIACGVALLGEEAGALDEGRGPEPAGPASGGSNRPDHGLS